MSVAFAIDIYRLVEWMQAAGVAPLIDAPKKIDILVFAVSI